MTHTWRCPLRDTYMEIPWNLGKPPTPPIPRIYAHRHPHACMSAHICSTSLIQTHTHAPGCSEHTQALKRLQREAFEQLVGVGSRVDALQEHAEEQARAAHPTLLPVGIPQHGEHDRPRVFLSGEVATAHCASNVQVWSCSLVRFPKWFGFGPELDVGFGCGWCSELLRCRPGAWGLAVHGPVQVHVSGHVSWLSLAESF